MGLALTALHWPYARNRHLELGQLENEAVGSQYVNNALCFTDCTTTNLLFSSIFGEQTLGNLGS